MTFMLTRVKVGNYDEWKPMFDSDPAGARASAKGHRVLRSTEDPNEVFIQVEFDSAADAEAARERLRSSGALDRVDVQNGPTIAELADATAY
jgi:hypothetical protein